MMLACHEVRLCQGFSLDHLESVVRIAGFIDKPGLFPSSEADGEGCSFAN